MDSNITFVTAPPAFVPVVKLAGDVSPESATLCGAGPEQPRNVGSGCSLDSCWWDGVAGVSAAPAGNRGGACGRVASPADRWATAPRPCPAADGALRDPVVPAARAPEAGGPASALAPERAPAGLSAPARVCPICFDALDPAEGETFCGVHLYCNECAGRSARAALRQGQVPRCPDCQRDLEPVAAQRILRLEDLERYHRLALWSNDGVAACPRCHEGLFADRGQDLSAGGRCRSAACPACGHEFCIECRGPAHPQLADCDEAERRRRRSRARRRGLELEPAELGLKACPRCRAVLEKLDEESCDHMTCLQCRHEFCWSCLADRIPIYAHGNHFHRPSCRFYAAYAAAAPEYLPLHCRRCAHRGGPCVPPALAQGAMLPAQVPLDAWFRRLLELLSMRSCQLP